MTSPLTTTQFVNSIGVNVHVEYTDGKYANTSNVLADLSYLGITHVRDAVLNPSNQGQSNYDTLAAAGIKFDFYFQGNSLSSTMKLVDSFVARHPGAVSMIEGPNEVNNYPISYNGQTGNAAAVAYQNALYTAIHSDSALKGVPVANLTSWPALAGSADDANFHSYPKNGAQPASTLANDASQEEAGENGKPVVMTEGGYTTLTASNYFGGVDQATQAKLLVNMVLDNAAAGVSSSYLYELLDAYADPTNSDPNKHFGLFNLDNSPKLAATAIHNLTTLLSTGADASASATTLGYSLKGLPSTGESMVMTKSAAIHDLVLWNEPTDWNSSTNSEVTVPATTVAVHLNSVSDVSVYDPLSSSSAIQVLHNVQDFNVSLTDHALVLEVTNSPSTSASATAATGSAAAAVSGHVALADSPTLAVNFDGDGRSDVLWRNSDGTVGEWLSSKGTGVGSYQGLDKISSDWTIAGTGDFDGDGKTDVLWWNKNGTVGEWLSSQGTGVAAYHQVANVSQSSWTVVGTGDFDGDGKADVLWQNKDGTVAEWLSSQGAGVAGYHALDKVSTSDWKIVGTGDFDGDGKADVLWRNKDGTVGEWLSSKGSGIASYQSLDKVSTDWQIVGVGDFDGDGKSDVLWWNKDGTVGEWLSSQGSGAASYHALGALSHSAWHVAGIGDFDGDGKSDVLWQNANGTVAEWLSSHGSGVASYSELGGVSTGWSIV